RLALAAPILGVAYLMTHLDFSLIWRYFAFSNMLLSTSVPWLANNHLMDRGTFHRIVSIPAVIRTAITLSYIANAANGLNLPLRSSKPMGIAIAVACLIGLWTVHNRRTADAAA